MPGPVGEHGRGGVVLVNRVSQSLREPQKALGLGDVEGDASQGLDFGPIEPFPADFALVADWELAVVEGEVECAVESHATKDLRQEGRQAEPPSAEQRGAAAEVPLVDGQTAPQFREDLFAAHQRQFDLVIFSADQGHAAFLDGLSQQCQRRRLSCRHFVQYLGGNEQIQGPIGRQFCAQRRSDRGRGDQRQVQEGPLHRVKVLSGFRQSVERSAQTLA